MNRRGFLRGLVAFVAAPAIVRATSLMPVRAIIADESFMPIYPGGVGAELAAITRKAFIPRVLVQIYQSNPLLAEFNGITEITA